MICDKLILDPFAVFDEASELEDVPVSVDVPELAW
jgi:hypothetical protein